MEKFLVSHVPTLWLGIGTVLIALATTLLGLVLVRRSVQLRKLKEQHDVAGFLIAVVGVLYAVLLGFMVVIQWEQFAAARDDATTEANAVGNLYRDAIALGPKGRHLAGAVDGYAAEIAYREWPHMAAHQEEDPNGDHPVNALWKEIRTLQPSPGAGQALITQAVADVTTASEERRKRIDESSSQLPAPLWVVLLVGGAVTVGFTYFFGLESFASQATMLSFLAILIALGLFVILTLDLPFTGDIAVKPSSLQAEIAEFCSYNFVNPKAGGNCSKPKG